MTSSLSHQPPNKLWRLLGRAGLGPWCSKAVLHAALAILAYVLILVAADRMLRIWGWGIGVSVDGLYPIGIWVSGLTRRIRDATGGSGN